MCPTKFFVVLLAMLPALMTPGVNWAEETGNGPSPLIKNAESCWSDDYASYAEWTSLMASRIAARNLPEKKAEKALAGFQRTFPEKTYEYFRTRIRCEHFTYSVDGIDVLGYLIRPANTQGRLPVVVYNRGGNGDFGAVTFTSMMRNLFPLADQGFIVIGSQYRGTFAKAGAADVRAARDEFGGSDIHDVRQLFDLIPDIQGADVERVGMWGHSRGGIQTFMTARTGVPARALVVAAGVADLAAGLEERPDMETVFRNRIPGYDDDKVAALQRRSVLYWAESLNREVPILLIHGSADDRVSVEQSRKLDQRLETLGFKHRLVEFEGDGHSFNKNRQAYIQAVADWFHQHLAP
ncbi:prolyl oligopeptidase family serine peptidase [Microbulbifer sp. CAU 1566]|uniref:alpha/beta hydrolase family protein n=1 Tax=Microbulbifer sp. CAU 1566 TaxID=2933269 RepID=UPI002002D965|nr:prolyl oligopeptidase family serine peptidase [Microbulbifer sp. CAU 1566]MCK7598194.1 prolyl oligopeptidase family serine peptidase [Microbulbifer sp. CAU 1566]